MSDKISLARTATGLTHATTLATLSLLIVYPALWIDPALATGSLAPTLPGPGQTDLPSWALAAGFGLGLIPLLLLIFGLWQVRRFFRLYGENDLFTTDAGRYLRNFGIALLVLVPMMIGRILTEAHRLAEESRQIV